MNKNQSASHGNSTPSSKGLLRWKSLSIVFALIFLALSALPNLYISDQSNMPNWMKLVNSEPIKLGLDLNGGVLLVLNVDLAHTTSARLQFLEDSVKTEARKKQIRGVRVQTESPTQLSISFANANTLNQMSTFIQSQFPEFEQARVSSNQMSLSLNVSEQLKLNNETMQQVLSTMRDRIESLGVTESVVQRQGESRIRIELPGVTDAEQAKKVIGSTATLDFYALKARSSKSFESASGEEVFVANTPIFTGKNVKNAIAGRDEMGIPLVNLILDEVGGQKVLAHSAKNIGKSMVTVYSEYVLDKNDEVSDATGMRKDSKVISVATIQSALGSRFSITNLDSPQQAQELALKIKAGALSAPVSISKEQTIDATLGKSNIENGMAALMLGLGITLAFMALWYRKLGFVANCALVFNLIALLGVMSLLPGAVLTLPGIAGLVLTVGMAVDTNVIIFERIKEELNKNKPAYLAINQGYKNALSSIVDANITTLLTAVILYSIGFGPVKGFAITLGLGVLTSLFTGVYISKLLSEWLLIKPSRQITAKPQLKGE